MSQLPPVRLCAQFIGLSSTSATAHVLVTGGAGFFGSHTYLLLLEAGHSLVVLDNFANSSPETLRRVLALAGVAAADRLLLIEGDIRHPADL